MYFYFLQHEKILKKQAKRDKMALQSAEIKRVGEILHLQSTLDLLGGNEVREDFKTGKHGAVVCSILIILDFVKMIDTNIIQALRHACHYHLLPSLRQGCQIWT